jgi:CHASE2 domain-containing sensor protein
LSWCGALSRPPQKQPPDDLSDRVGEDQDAENVAGADSLAHQAMIAPRGRLGFDPEPMVTLLLAFAGIVIGLIAWPLESRGNRAGMPLLLLATGLLIAAVVTVVVRNAG